MAALFQNSSKTVVVASLVITSIIVPTLLISGVLKALWGVIDIIQVLHYYIFINIDLPGNLVGFLGFFISPGDQIPSLFYSLLKFLSERFSWLIPQQIAPLKFASQGINPFYLNRGVSLVIYIGGLTILALVTDRISNYLHMRNSKYHRFFNKFSVIFKWNFVIRYIMVNYTSLSFWVFIQFLDLSERGSLSIVGYGLAGCTLIMLLVYPLLLFKNITERRVGILKRKFIITHETLIKEYNILDESYGPHFLSFHLIRQVIFIGSIVGLNSYPAISLIILSMQSLLTIIIIIEFQPFARKICNKTNLTREIVMLCINIELIVVDQYEISVPKRLYIGWSIIGLICLVVSINMIILIFDAAISWKEGAYRLYNYIKSYRSNGKLRKRYSIKKPQVIHFE